MPLTIDFGAILSFLSALGIIAGVVYRNETRLGKIDSEIVSLKTQISPFWEMLKAKMPKMLVEIAKNPFPLKENDPDKMTMEELVDLKKRLQKQIEHSPLRSDVLFALMYIEYKIREEEKDGK